MRNSIRTTPIALPTPRAVDEAKPAIDQRRSMPERAKRALFAGSGIVCVGLGGLGVIVPGLPTTVFLLIASWCFARSCPWLTNKLIHNRVFGPFVTYLEPGAVMPLKAKLISLAMMWGAIGGSCWWVTYRGAPWFVPATIILAGLAGTWFIARQGRKARPAGAHTIDETGARSMRHASGRRPRVHTNGPCTTPTSPPSNTR